MIAREDILSIEEYCTEHNVSHKDRLEELGISPLSFTQLNASTQCYKEVVKPIVDYFFEVFNTGEYDD